MASHSLSSLKRWSCVDSELPSVDSIKALHVYDFDNTLFASPLPNKQVWHGSTVGFLQNQHTFVNGGWWHDSNILKATGKGIDIEEPRAWKGWWNEHIVNLVQLSMDQKDALNVLLTGRSERGFADVVERIVKSRNLKFDLVVLRPEVGPADQHFNDTMNFKQVFLTDLLHTYSQADEIRLYEDRVKHVAKFRNFFDHLRTSLLSNPTQSRKPFQPTVIEVAENAISLDPLAEIAAVQKMINTHNTAYAAGTLPRPTNKPFEIKRLVLFTGYLIKPQDTRRLISLAKLSQGANPSPTSGIDRAYHTLANNIMITPRPCPPHILEKVGGLGRKFTWRATALGSFDNKVWAMRVEPVPRAESFYSENPVPMVVLATRGTGKPIEANRINRWVPLGEGEGFEFETEVWEKVLLRVEEERRPQVEQGRGGGGDVNVNVNGKRGRLEEEDFPPLGAPQQKPGPSGGQGQRRDFTGGRGGPRNRGGGHGGNKLGGGNQGQGKGGGGGSNRGKGGGQSSRGRGGGGGGGRNRGGYGSYRSLDGHGPAGDQRFAFGFDGADDRGLTY